MQTRAALAQHTARFHEWELLGRGWQTHEHLVPLEPCYRPFQGHRSVSVAPQDDGRRPTFLSKVWDRITGRVPPSPVPLIEAGEETTPLELDIPEDVRDETELLIPEGMKVDASITTSFLRAVATATDPIAFELIGTDGRVCIRFATSPIDTRTLRLQLATLLPDATIIEPERSLARLWRASEGEPRVVEFGLEREFMLPLREIAKGPDPLIPFIAALAGAGSDELAILQVLFAPARAPWAEDAWRAIHSPDGEPFFIDSPELTKLAQDKLSAPLYAVSLRVLVMTEDHHAERDLLRGIGGALNQYGSPDRNGLTHLPAGDDEDLQYNVLLRCTNRSGMLLSLPELAGLVRLPGAEVRTPALIRELEAFPELPEEVLQAEGVELGLAQHGPDMVPVRLSTDARLQHLYVIGASGTGKSTLLENVILQDIHAGRGVAVLDPHGDLVDELLARIPDHRIDDVVLFDPSDPDWVVGWNILGAYSDVEKELLASDLVDVFRRLSTSWGDQMSAVLGNAVLAFLHSNAGGTLEDLRKFLLDEAFRKAFLGTVADEHARIFWRDEFPLLVGKKPQAPILTRLNTLLRNRLVREAVVERDKPLNFRDIMDGQKVFLAKLAQGAIGEENAALLGSLLVSKFHQVALTRQDTALAARTPFFLFADEFQNVATPSMAGLFSGVRKYKLAMCVAHQDLYQLHGTAPELERSILSNAYTRVLFRVSEEDARKVERGMGDYGAEDLVGLGRGEAICRVGKGGNAFPLTTRPLPFIPDDVAEHRRALVRSRSLTRFGRQRTRAVKQDGAPPADPTARNSAEDQPKGRGGRQHKHLQSLLMRSAKDHGFAVKAEQTVLDGHGHVDLALERNGLRVACEISVSTSPSHELDNLSKCLAAGFEYAVLVSVQEATLRNARRRFSEEFPEELAGRALFFSPEDFIQWLEEARTEAFARGPQQESSKDRAKPGSKSPKAKQEARAEPPPSEEGLFDAIQAAAYVRRAPQTLAKLRSVGGGPPFYKLGRNIFYKREDLDAWLDARRRRSTSDDGTS